MLSSSEINLALVKMGFSTFSGYATWPCFPKTFNVPLKEPRLPILMVSPTFLFEEGSPTKQ